MSALPFNLNATTTKRAVGCRFWVVKETDKQSTQEWKTKQIKDFLVNALDLLKEGYLLSLKVKK